MQQDRSPLDSSPQTFDMPISFAKARSLLAAQCEAILAGSRFDVQTCELAEALGRILAEPLVANRDQPPFARVTRDGFAVRAEDLAAGVPLRVIGELRAGEGWPHERPPVRAGEAVEIMTGAPLPPGCDAVLMVEHAQDVSGEAAAGIGDGRSGRFVLAQPGRLLHARENVVPRGTEAQQGQVLIPSGTRLGPDAIGLAASCGMLSVPVIGSPQVAILATGDELVQRPAFVSGQETRKTTIESHQIYDSNSHSLAALVRQAYAVPLPQAAARDRREDLAARIRQAFTLAPLLLITGGVSMGRYDLVEEVLTGMGAEFFFTGVKMQPGKPVVFGRVPASDDLPERYFFGLPGNPVSTMVTFRVFVQPLLAAMTGEQQWQPPIAVANMATELRVKPGLTRFLPAHLDTTQSDPVVTLVPTQGSGDLVANARANCYVIVPEDCETILAQSPVRVLLR